MCWGFFVSVTTWVETVCCCEFDFVCICLSFICIPYQINSLHIQQESCKLEQKEVMTDEDVNKHLERKYPFL
jgi:hypothetical protein